MATVSAVCVDGNFQQYSTLSGSQIRCTGTLENREYSPALEELSQADINELSVGILTFFTVCYVVRFVIRFVAESSPSRGG